MMKKTSNQKLGEDEKISPNSARLGTLPSLLIDILGPGYIKKSYKVFRTVYTARLRLFCSEQHIWCRKSLRLFCSEQHI